MTSSVIQYMGSKLKLLPWLQKVIGPYLGPEVVFADLFAGSGNVARHFSTLAVKAVVANDIEGYSYVLNHALLTVPYQDKLAAVIDKLNALKGRDGLIAKHYAEGSPRLFFSAENGRKIDAARAHIGKLRDEGAVTEDEYTFLLASLIAAVDRRANSMGMYQTFLKKLHPGACKPLVIEPIHTNERVNRANRVYQEDAAKLAGRLRADVVYLDPPYAVLQYGSFYHLLNYLCRYDTAVKPEGVGGIVEGYTRSSFSSRVRCRQAFEDLVGRIKARHVFLSYSNEAIVSKAEITAILEKHGKVTVHQHQHDKYNYAYRKNNKYTVEYLFHLERRPDAPAVKELLRQAVKVGNTGGPRRKSGGSTVQARSTGSPSTGARGGGGLSRGGSRSQR